MRFFIGFLVTIVTSLTFGFVFLFYPHIEVLNVTYSQNECSVVHSVPTKFQINDLGIQQNVLNIMNCNDDEKQTNFESLYADLSSLSEEAYEIKVVDELQQYYKSNHFFYIENSNFQELTDIVENNTFIFNDLPHKYLSSFEYIKYINHNIFFKKQKQIQKEILFIVRVKPNNDLEISYKYNNNPEDSDSYLHNILSNSLSKNKYTKIK
jgi:hypothetical protein